MLTPSSIKLNNTSKIGPNGTVQRWRRLVRIVYFDEAGTSSNVQEPYLVVAGIIVHGDTQWLPIETYQRQIIDTLVPQELRAGFHFHAERLFSDHKEFKGLLSRETRFAIIREVLGIMAIHKLPVAYGAVTKDAVLGSLRIRKAKQSFAHELAFLVCVKNVQCWFRDEAPSEVGMGVAATVDTYLSLKRTFSSFRRPNVPTNADFVLHNLVDALHFTEAKESIGLQLADAAAFVIKRHLMGKANTDAFYEIIKPLLTCKPESALWPLMAIHP